MASLGSGSKRSPGSRLSMGSVGACVCVGGLLHGVIRTHGTVRVANFGF